MRKESSDWETCAHLAWSVACMLGLWMQARHVLLYLRGKPILLQGFGDRVTKDLVVFYTLTLSTGNAVGMFILFGARLPGSLALLLSSVSAFFFTTTILYLSVEVGFQYAHLHMQTTDLFEDWDEDLVHLGLRMLVMAGSTIFMLLRTTLGAYGANYPRLLQQDVEINFGVSAAIWGIFVVVSATVNISLRILIHKQRVALRVKENCEHRQGGGVPLAAYASILLILVFMTTIAFSGKIEHYSSSLDVIRLRRGLVLGMGSFPVPFCAIMFHRRWRAFAWKRLPLWAKSLLVWGQRKRAVSQAPGV